MLLGKSLLVRREISIFFVIITALGLYSCGSKDKLPVYGERELGDKGDTLYHTIPAFSFVNQFGETITNNKFDNHIYVADFFFTTCPGTCPIMTTSMVDLQSQIGKGKLVKFLSHTVNPETDSIAALLSYAEKKGADFSSWDFVTGNKQELYEIAAQYFAVAAEDVTDDLNFIHSEHLILVDKKGRVRGLYSGVVQQEVAQLEKDIKVLLLEN